MNANTLDYKKEQLYKTARIAVKPAVFTEYSVGDFVAVKWVREWPAGNHQYEIDGRGPACVMGGHLLDQFVL